MAQEVQTTLDYRAELNEIQWIWYQQRRISDKMQVREKVTNRLSAKWGASIRAEYWEVFVSSWTSSTKWGVTYTINWGTIRIPLWWAYMVYMTPDTSGSSYYYQMRVYVNWKETYYLRTTLGDIQTRREIFNFGRGDEITVSFTAEFSAIWGASVLLEFVKL